MKNLKDPDKFALRCLPPQKKEQGLTYTLSPYVIKAGLALYNALTDEAVLVSDYQDKNEQRELIRRWFLVPVDLDMTSIVHLIRQKSLLPSIGPGQNVKGTYVIFTTTACNASCEYCFEKGCKVLTMSEDTANYVANYIVRTHRKDKAIKIKWFGGEPLLNKKVMNLISTKLKDNDVKYWCEISSNGELFPECSDEEIRLWRPKKVQFTFDDIYDEYERIKGTKPGSYEHLKTTIERLDKLKIRMPIRIHYDPNKGSDNCYRIIDDLSGYSYTRFYARILYDKATKDDYKELLKIEDYILEKKAGVFDFPLFDYTYHCMADNPRIACITPTGGLSPCEHHSSGEHLYGSVYSKEKDYSELNKWTVREKAVTPSCKECPLYPSCRKIVMCPAEGKCSDGYQYYQIETIKRALRKKVEEVNGSVSK